MSFHSSCSRLRHHRALLPILFLLVIGSGRARAQTSWQPTESAAASAAKAAKFAEAEKLLLQNQQLAEKYGEKDARMGRTIFDLGEVYRAEGKYGEALAAYERAAKLNANDSADLARVLEGQGEVYRNLNDFGNAEPLLKKALDLRTALHPPDEAAVAESQNDLGEVYTLEGSLAAAKPLLDSALETRKRTSNDGRALADSYQVFGIFYRKTLHFAEAEASFRQAMSLYGKAVGGEHPDYANAMENLALTLVDRKDYPAAEALLQRTLDIRMHVLGASHRDIAASYDDLAALSRAEKKPLQAADYYLKAIAVQEQIFGKDAADLAPDLNNLGAIYELLKGKQEEAEKCFLRALAIDEKASGAESLDVATDLNNLALDYGFMRRYQEAADAYQKTLSIRSKALGERDPATIQSMTGYALTLHLLHRESEAQALETRIRRLQAGPGN